MTRTLVIGDPVVVLGNGREPVIGDGALVIEDRVVTEVGPRAELESHGPFDSVIGSPGHLVMPGFVNGHFHGGSYAHAGMPQYIFERANVSVHGNRGTVDEEFLHAAYVLSYLDCLKGGQTAVVDFSYGRPEMDLFGNEPILRAYEDVGIRAALGFVTRDRNKYVHAPDDHFLAMLPPELRAEVAASPMGYAWPTGDVVGAYRKLTPQWDGRDGRIRCLLAPDWTPANSDECYLLMRQLADEYDTGIMTHVLETKSEMIFNLKHHGKTAMRRLADLGVLGPDVSVDHFVWATDEDIAILADTGAVAVNNPGSNLRLSTGVCRTRDILDRGGMICFGTDSIGFAPDEDFFEELRLAMYLQRLPGRLDVGRLDTLQVLSTAAQAGARALRMEDRIGSLEPGKEADLLVLRKDGFMKPAGKFAVLPILDVLADRAEADDIETVMVAGKVVVQDGRSTVVDEDALWALVENAIAEGAYAAGEGKWERWGQLGREVEPYVFEFFEPWADLPVKQAYTYNAVEAPDVSGLA
ncbi:MAG: amidohydrolase family protein [Actinomycetota bacterium]|nr:amidohydrolase family protein [Actinomycetota bacterium]